MSSSRLSPTGIALTACCIVCLGVLPVIATADTPARMEVLALEDLARSQGIPQPLSTLRAFTADAGGKNVAWYFEEKSTFFLYKNGTLLRTGPIFYTRPLVFSFLEGGRLLWSMKPSELYLDRTRLSSGNRRNNFTASVNPTSIVRGKLLYADANSVRSYDLATGKRAVLYAHPGLTVFYLRAAGDDVYYTVRTKNNRYFFYKNGKKFDPAPVANPSNFLISKGGSPYFFTETANDYRIIRNGRTYYGGTGKGGFLFEDEGGSIWHVSYTLAGTGAHVSLHRDGQPASAIDFANVEGSLSFSGDHVAARVSLQEDPRLFYLYKDGAIVGDGFPFEGVQDFNGIQFTPDGAAYMRNFDGSRWALYEDGKKILQETFGNVWFFRVVEGKVRVYGTGGSGR